MLYFVYELVDPRTNQPFYVGITKNPNYRMEQHLTAKDSNKRKKARIVDIQSEGFSPRMRIIETTENERTVFKKETYWIHKYIEQGIALTNILKSKPSMLSESWPSLLTSIDPSLAHLECFDLDMYIVVASPSLSSVYKPLTPNFQILTGDKRDWLLTCTSHISVPIVCRVDQGYTYLAFALEQDLLKVYCPCCSKMLGCLRQKTKNILKDLGQLRASANSHQCSEYARGIERLSHKTSQNICSIIEATS